MKKILFCIILLIFCSALFGADFTFIQTGGEHFSAYPQSEETIKSIKHREDYIFRDMLFPKPSFVIETGNITELGDTENFGDLWEKTYKYLGLPHYYIFGNRDLTWNPMTARKENINSSFDFGGVHFILLNSCGLLDSRPCFAEETLTFLRDDLMQTNSATPLILVFHHSWGGDEWSDPLDWERIKDMTQSYNLIACLTGHGEKPECVRYEGVPLICGGSAYGKERGYMVHSITDGVFRSLYMNKETGSLTLFYEKDLKTKNKKPEIVFLSPKQGEET
ncbi:MAG: metallophosphoesterase, partial [Armatimonadetes bacterium]|nr:metallophosphoesterase [Candidatus Hippobium faecium]